MIRFVFLCLIAFKVTSMTAQNRVEKFELFDLKTTKMVLSISMPVKIHYKLRNGSDLLKGEKFLVGYDNGELIVSDRPELGLLNQRLNWKDIEILKIKREEGFGLNMLQFSGYAAVGFSSFLIGSGVYGLVIGEAMGLGLLFLGGASGVISIPTALYLHSLKYRSFSTEKYGPSMVVEDSAEE